MCQRCPDVTVESMTQEPSGEVGHHQTLDGSGQGQGQGQARKSLN